MFMCKQFVVHKLGVWKAGSQSIDDCEYLLSIQRVALACWPSIPDHWLTKSVSYRASL